jgi:prophage regulatory protein
MSLLPMPLTKHHNRQLAADPMSLLLRRLDRIEEAISEIISAINRRAPKTVLRMPEVERRTGLKKSAIYALIQKKEFPAPVKIGELTGFVESEVESWIEARIRERDQGHGDPPSQAPREALPPLRRPAKCGAWAVSGGLPRYLDVRAGEAIRTPPSGLDVPCGTSPPSRGSPTSR